ncbi:MAG: hypothetical protein AMS14_07250 [Planctomycetes bacterium DG_20]|nr:MAG: hypothetical protein AMS14_07250 [Planctomycetes bacterium DG_20]
MEKRMRTTVGITVLVVGVATLVSLPVPLGAADQPQWGQAWSRNMVSDETGLPGSFEVPKFDADTGEMVPGTGRNVRWAVRLGSVSYGTPIIARGKVLVGTNNGFPRDPRHQGDRGVLMCFSEADGRFLWQLVCPKLRRDPYLDWTNIGICSPASVEGDRLYIVGNRAEVLCLDLDGQADGNDGPYVDEGVHMAREGQERLEVLKTDGDSRQHDGCHCSVLLHGQFVYASTSNGVDRTHFGLAPDAPSLVVLDKTTGRLVAIDGEGLAPRIIHSMWSSCAAGKASGRELVVFAGGDAIVYAFEPLRGPSADGRPAILRAAWRFDCDPGAPKKDIMKWQDNRKEGPSTIIAMPVFLDGRVYVTAGGDPWHGKREAWLKCIDASGSGDITRSGQVWSYDLSRHSLSTPAVRDGLVYAADSTGQVHCVDARTGKPYWVHPLEGEVWSSPLVADGKVFVGTVKGDFYVLAAGKEKRLISQVRLPGSVWASPVAAGGRLYVVSRQHLFAFERMEK